MIKVTKWEKYKGSNAVNDRMDRAYVLALQGTLRQKHGAILMQGRRVLAVGVNSYRNPAETWPDATVHAEIGATSIYSHRLVPNTTLYVVRVNRKGEFALSAPCQECLKYLTWQTNVKEVIHS